MPFPGVWRAGMATREMSPSRTNPRGSAHDLIPRTAPSVTQGSFIPLRTACVAVRPSGAAGIEAGLYSNWGNARRSGVMPVGDARSAESGG